MSEPYISPEARPDKSSAGAPPGEDPLTGMAPHFGRLAYAFGRRFFEGFRFERGAVDVLREIERGGAVVYVMRYSSRLDYLLFNWLFLANGIRLSALANGIRVYYYRPLGEAIRLWTRGLIDRLSLGKSGMRERQILRMREVLRGGGSLFLFLRTAKIGQELRTRRRRVVSGQSELDYLREVVDLAFVDPAQISLVPLALFWRRGIRAESSYLNIFYGAPARPTDTGKMLSFLWNYRSLAVRVGTPIDLRAFVDERREEGRERVVKQVRRSVLIFLRREEKPVDGPALRLIAKVEEIVISDSEVQRAIDSLAVEGKSRRRIEARARKNLREIAARQSGTALAVLDVIVGWMFGRLFGRVEVHGLDRIVEAAKLHPLVLVPSHRSHFDYLILSWLFYEHRLVPPHVAAGINLAFWPLGGILRRAGGFFLRRTFDGDPLYSAVFRSYVCMLIKDGATQEFFIEGTRSRTGKTLIPRLGMLGMVVEAFGLGVRKDVYLVPIAFTYERLVEESAITEERRGAKKTGESLLSLFRARRIFRHRFGSVIVRFGEPISLAKESGLGSPTLEGVDTPAPLDLDGTAERRQLTARLGNELCRRINDLTTAGRSAVSSAALLASTGEGLREDELGVRVLETVVLLRKLGMPLSEPLEALIAEGRPEAALELLLQSRLVERRESRTGDLIHFKKDVRDRLDLYRSSLTPRLVWGSVLALALREGGGRQQVLAEASTWLVRLRLEFFPPEEEAGRRERLELVLEHIMERGWAKEDPSRGLTITPEGLSWCAFLVAQISPILEAYHACFRVVEAFEGRGGRKMLLAEAEAAMREQLLLGEARFPEGLSPVSLANAFELLLREKVLLSDSRPGKADALTEPGPRWSRLQELRRSLAGALETR